MTANSILLTAATSDRDEARKYTKLISPPRVQFILNRLVIFFLCKINIECVMEFFKSFFLSSGIRVPLLHCKD